jgi:hypothetical protein
VKIRLLSFYRGIFIIAPSSIDLGRSFNSFKIITGRCNPDGNMCHPDGAIEDVQKVFLTHGCLQYCSDEIVDELFCRLLFMAHFDLVNIGISLTS